MLCIYTFRSCSLSELQLVPGEGFFVSLLLEHLTAAMLLSLARLAGYLDSEHSLSSILQAAHCSANTIIALVSTKDVVN